MSSARKKPAPASVFSVKTGSSPTSSAASSSSNTPVTPATTGRVSTLHHVNSRNSVESGAGRHTQGSIATGSLSATAAAWHPTVASRALWQTNAQTFAGPVFPASPVLRGEPATLGSCEDVATAGSSQKSAHEGSNPSSSAGPTPTLPPVRSHDVIVSPAAFPADFNNVARFRSSRSSLDVPAVGGDENNKLEDEVVMEFVPLSDHMAQSEAQIIANMVGAQRVGGANHSVASNHSSGADTDDFNEMVDEMDRVHEQIGTPATLHPRNRNPANRSGSHHHGDVSTPMLSFALGPAHLEGAAAGDAGPSSLSPVHTEAALLGMGMAHEDEEYDDDFDDYATEFDDELDEAELEWIEQQLKDHSESHNDPGLFMF